jgi:uncharacterized protein YwqG
MPPAKAELARLGVAELAQAYIESVQAAGATDHIGRQNRLARQRWDIVCELKARGEARSVLERLAHHATAEVRKWANGNLASLDRAPPQPLPHGRFWPNIIWQCDHLPPSAMTREEIEDRLRRSVPEASERLLDLLRPAVGLWPQRRDSTAALASRFGGIPLAPEGWQWPMFEQEPRLFIGQINCAELRGLPGAEPLPTSGLLAFFGDHDAVTGCFPFDSQCVFYWPDPERLVPAEAAIEPLEIFPCCALVLRPFLDLPHPSSRALGKFGLSKQQWRSYFDAWTELREYGIPREYARYAQFSKLLGWPALVQGDLQKFETRGDTRLLLQVDGYCNGVESHGWGPGGSLFYVLSEQDLRARAFACCDLVGQFT